MKEVKSSFKELGEKAREEGKMAGEEAKRNLKGVKEAFKPDKSKKNRSEQVDRLDAFAFCRPRRGPCT
jgi:hypothetical protein